MTFAFDDKRTWRTVLVLTGLIFVLYSIFAVWRHTYFLTHGHDLGIFDQGLWKLAHFSTPDITIRKIPVPNIFGDHFHPILLLLIPFYWIFNSPIVLLVVQAALLSSSLPLAYLLARQLNMAAHPSVLLAIATAIHPGIFLAVSFDFHELSFAVPLILAIFLFAEKKKWFWYWIALGLLILTKESMPVYAALIGLTLLLRKQWKIGGLTMAISLASYFIITKLLIPAFAGPLDFAYWDQYKHLSSSSATLPLELVKHPVTFAKEFFNAPEKVSTMKWMLGSFGFLPLLSWSTLPLVIMTFAERFWANNYGLWLFQFHYQLVMVALFSAATIFTIRDFTGRWPKLKNWHLPIACVILLMTLLTWSQFAWPKIRETGQNFPEWSTALGMIPKKDIVAAQDVFVPHLSHRDIIYQLPRVRDAQWILLDPRAQSWPLTGEDVVKWQNILRTNPKWKMVYEKKSLTLFQRIDQGNEDLPLNLDWP